MIKVNLLNNRAVSGSQSINISGGGAGISEGSDLEKLALKNFVILISLTALLFVFEFQNISGLESRLNVLRTEFNNLSAEVESKRVFAVEAEKLQNELKQIKERVEIIKVLSKNRLLELRAMDILQNLVPEKVWFERVNYQNHKFDVDAVAVDIEDVTIFKDALDNQDTFKNIMIRNTQERELKNNTVHSFSMSFEVEAFK
ncbi:MAG: PilN domain-containing protein [Bdellovibrionales bacterium]|nr:PilN domain-containing protein [Bdellovibrionales bacterium]